MNGARSVVPADCTSATCPAIWWLNRVTVGAGRIITVVPLTNADDMGRCPDSGTVALGVPRQAAGRNFTLDGIVEIRVGGLAVTGSTDSGFLSAYTCLPAIQEV